MGIIIIIFAILLFNKRIKDETQNDKILIWMCVIAGCIFSIVLNWYQEFVVGWQYGVSGSDLLSYFEAAQEIVRNQDISTLEDINKSFSTSILNWGYISYPVFIALTTMTPIIINQTISLHILYFIQVLALVVAGIDYTDCFTTKDDKKTRNTVLVVLILCASALQSASVLLRDVWIFFICAQLFRECNKEAKSLKKICVYLILSTIMRPYTAFMNIPVIIFYYFNERLLGFVILNISVLFLLVSKDVMILLSDFFNISYYKGTIFGLSDMVGYLVFPNPVNQSYNIQHVTVTYLSNFGGNTEWLYYILSCWNLFVLPIAVLGLVEGINNREIDTLFWFMTVLVFSIIMCLYYKGVSAPRHKLLILPGVIFLFFKGIKKLNLIVRLIYSGFVVFVLVLLLLIV